MSKRWKVKKEVVFLQGAKKEKKERGEVVVFSSFVKKKKREKNEVKKRGEKELKKGKKSQKCV